MSIKDGEPPNVEGAPTLVYELWSTAKRDEHGAVLWPEEQPWVFVAYRVLSLRQVLKYQEFGYHVERSHRRDRNGTLPLFPRLDSADQDPGNGLDPMPVPEPGPSGSQALSGYLLGAGLGTVPGLRVQGRCDQDRDARKEGGIP